MTRFFVHPHQIENGEVVLEADDAHHLRTVLKAQPGTQISVLDGLGHEYPAVLHTLTKTRAAAKLKPAILLGTEAATRITIAQALPKVGDKMEQVLQRGTEIGAAAFWAYESERSLTHLTGERAEKRLHRWHEIVKTAAEQSHRAMLPEVRAQGSLRDLLTHAPEFDLTLLAHEGERETSLRQVLSRAPSPKTILVFVGPESGFTDAEAALARRAGAQPVTLGQRILRTETASLVLLSQILFALEA